MKKVFIQIRKHWITNLVALGITLMIFVGIFCAVFFTRTNKGLVAAIDATTYGGLGVLVAGLFAWLAHMGTFDLISFGFRQLGSIMFAKDPRKDGGYHEYRQEKLKKRDDSSYSFLIMIAVGLLAFLAVMVMLIIMNILIY